MSKRMALDRKVWGGGRLLWALLLGSVVFFFPSCLLLPHHHAANSATAVAPGEQPDKILLDKALNEFKHGRYDVGRLTLQTLLNTYPDSEYLSQAKLAIANSYYKQGGIAGLTEAEAEYKDFMTFFPTAPEAPRAQYLAGMCFFRLIGRADRDQSEAENAEREFREFLTRYPENPLMPKVTDRLREVQEVLGRGNYEIAMFYYDHGAYPAAESRLKQVAAQYPNFSQGDQVYWYLGQTLAKLKHPEEATPYYDRLIMEFPLSPLVKDAKRELAAMHEPVPEPTKAMLARAEADADAAKWDHRGLLQRMLTPLSSSPNLSTTLHGPVVLGSPGQLQVQIAKLNGLTKPAPPPGKNSLSVQTASAASLKPEDPAPPQKSSSKASNAGHTQAKATKQQNIDLAQVSPEKKHGKLHFLHKLIP